MRKKELKTLIWEKVYSNKGLIFYTNNLKSRIFYNEVEQK